MNFLCVLCSRDIVNSVERYRIEGKGKFNVVKALKELPFEVRCSSTFICKQCLAKLKKRSGLKEQLTTIDNEMKDFYFKSMNASSHTEIEGSDILCSTPKKRCLVSPSFRPSTSTPVKESISTTKISESLPAISPIEKSMKKTDVIVKVNWPSKESLRKLPDDLESLGKMLVRGTYKQIAFAAWKNPGVNTHLRELMVKEISKEAAGLCSSKDPSCFRKTDKDSMLQLSMERVSSELKDRAPCSILSSPLWPLTIVAEQLKRNHTLVQLQWLLLFF